MRDLIDVPYLRGGSGAHGIDCWHLVRQACQRVHGVVLPLLADAVADLPPLLAEARAQGWAPVRGQPVAGDILLMRTATQQRHVGLVVRERHRLELLHAAHGGSLCQPLVDLPALGFHHFRPWRLKP
jgi:cell wall-associated NlpC family hydrolase